MGISHEIPKQKVKPSFTGTGMRTWKNMSGIALHLPGTSLCFVSSSLRDSAASLVMGLFVFVLVFAALY